MFPRCSVTLSVKCHDHELAQPVSHDFLSRPCGTGSKRLRALLQAILRALCSSGSESCEALALRGFCCLAKMMPGIRNQGLALLAIVLFSAFVINDAVIFGANNKPLRSGLQDAETHQKINFTNGNFVLKPAEGYQLRSFETISFAYVRSESASLFISVNGIGESTLSKWLLCCFFWG